MSSIPSSISTARRTSAGGRLIRSIRFAFVFATKSRLTADFDVAARPGVDLIADGLERAPVTACGDADEHLLEHVPGQRIAIGEVLICPKPDLALAVGRPRPRTLDRDPPPAERDLAVIVAMTDRGALRVVLALRPHDLVDLGLHNSARTPRPIPTFNASNPSFAEWTSSPSASSTLEGARAPAPSSVLTTSMPDTVLMAVPPVLDGLSHHERSQRERTRREDRHLKFYTLRDKLHKSTPTSVRPVWLVRLIAPSAGQLADESPVTALLPPWPDARARTKAVAVTSARKAR